MWRRRTDSLEPYRERIAAIAAREDARRRASDAVLSAEARQLARRVRDGEPAGERVVTAFALVREVCRRTLGLRPHDVQIAGGLALLAGNVVEMPTGEGKTLTAVAPAFLQALAGRGVHVLTFNDYLARRDAAWMGPAYRMLGLTVGVVGEGMRGDARRTAYRADVTYVTAKEAGFDHLRDGLCLEPGLRVHRPFHAVLVDEADSIMIDEARIPLVIAAEGESTSPQLERLARIVRELGRGADYDTDEYDHNVFLTETGATRVEARLGCGSLYTVERARLLAAVRNALHAEALLERDVDYVVRDGTVELVDELTGRVAENRHWPDGLQAAVEAKERVRPSAGGRILGSLTLQHFLRLYPHACGMTATAASAADELLEFYGRPVAVIPPHRGCRRVDEPDAIFTHGDARDRAVVAEVQRAHRSGRPVLVGTESVAASERLATALDAAGVPCRVLNAKNDEVEAAVVAEAGRLGAVTISTNMAGRGTDIRLGGSDPSERERVVALGGLRVIGTNKHESRRIDDQLRGRAGRQGDPGSSRLFVALDDHLLQRYGIAALIPRRLFPAHATTPVDSAVVRREVERAQRIVEGEGFDVRRRLTAYSGVVDYQRREIQAWRQAVLEGTLVPDLLAARAGERWQRLVAQFGLDALRAVERRLTLLVIDRCWGEYLDEMQVVRDESQLVVLDGRVPQAEFTRTAIAAFRRLDPRIDEQIVAAFADLPVGPDGADWDAAGLRGPSATWTYLVHDDVFHSNVMMTLAHRPTIAVWGVLTLWPVLLVWGLWQRRKRRNEGPV